MAGNEVQQLKQKVAQLERKVERLQQPQNEGEQWGEDILDRAVSTSGRSSPLADEMSRVESEQQRQKAQEAAAAIRRAGGTPEQFTPAQLVEASRALHQPPHRTETYLNLAAREPADGESGEPETENEAEQS